MSHYSDNLWAEGLGIDLDELQTERFDHPDQLANHRRIRKQAADYWARERYLARLGDVIPAEATEDIPTPKPRKRRSDAKLTRYEFTDKQLEIARRVLDARDSV